MQAPLDRAVKYATDLLGIVTAMAPRQPIERPSWCPEAAAYPTYTPAAPDPSLWTGRVRPPLGSTRATEAAPSGPRATQPFVCLWTGRDFVHAQHDFVLREVVPELRRLGMWATVAAAPTPNHACRSQPGECAECYVYLITIGR